MNRNLINLLKSLMLPISLVLSAALFLGCGDSEEGSNGGAGAGGLDDGKGGQTTDTGGTNNQESGAGGTNGQPTELTECLPQDPPLADPYCYNPRCPIQLPGVDPANKPKGNCCNTVDVKLMEDAMSEGETYDLEFATVVSLPTNNANLFAPIIEDATQTRQEAGGDLTLYRLKGVPRSADIEKGADGSPVPVEVTLESGPGKLNCDGTYSFFGPNAGLPPVVEEGTPNDPSRWQSSETKVNYYGPEGEYLFLSGDESVNAANGVRWSPRWQEDGIYLEIGYRFAGLKWKTENMDDHLSCIGSINKDGEWQRAETTWTFMRVDEAKYMLVSSLNNQSMCGLYALGAIQGECADTPQSEWTVKPTVYCNEESYCWVGSSTDSTYNQFWEEFYEGENGCDSTGAGEHPCCDPAGEDSTLPACNAYPTTSTFVLAAVEITDNVIDNPDEAISWAANCTN